MLAYQQSQSQPQQRAAGVAPSPVAAALPTSVAASNSRLRFGSASIAAWAVGSSKPELPRHASPKSHGAYRLPVANDAPSPLRSQTGPRASPRPAKPAPAAGHQWQRVHPNVRPLRRVPNTSDISKQWRASPAAADVDAGARPPLAINTAAPPPARERTPFISSTFQDSDASLLSGLSLALHKQKHPVQADGPTKPATPLYDVPQPRTPHPLSPADSMKTPGYVDPESLPFELGSTITDAKTGRQYRLLSVLGEGSYAVVYLAYCSHDGAKYALKCLSKLDLTPRQLSLQRTELEIHASVCPHPHIVTLYSHFETGDWLFLVMERVAGPDLYDYITQHPAFNANQEERRFGEATRLFEQMIDAVAHIHALKAYHRDLKPENFIIGADGNLKLTDFGLATRESLSEDFECGSKPYMSYENRNGGLNPSDPTMYGPRDDYSPRLSDVWALGVLFLNLMFAQSPWTDPSRESCFKFCRFLREGAGFLASQFPKLPREVADFLVTRVFSPESGRCNVLELKQWVQDLGFPFSAHRPATIATATATATAAPRPAVSRHKPVAASRKANGAAAVPVAPLPMPGVAAAAAAQGSSSHASLSLGRKWSPGAAGPSGAYTKGSPYAPPLVAASVLEAAGGDFGAAKPASPTAWRSPMAHPIKAARPEAPGVLSSKPNNLSSSVPALVFSQIIPATQAAAARKMMPRELNPTAAKAAAAILQSSMLCLPKNGLGQGKQDYDSESADGSASQDDFARSSHLESLSEAEEDAYEPSGHAPAYSVAAADLASRFPHQPTASSLGFSAFGSDNDDDCDLDYPAPLSVGNSRAAQRLDAATGAKSLPPSALKKPMPRASAATIGSTVNGSSFSDDFDILGRFSDDDDDRSRRPARPAAGAASALEPVHNSSRVRFRGVPQSPPAVVPLPHGARALPTHDSADSSLTGTLVSPSADFYSPHMPSRTTTEFTSATSTAVDANKGADADADDEAESSRRTRHGGAPVLRRAQPAMHAKDGIAKAAAGMHSLPAQFHGLSRLGLSLDGPEHTAFSWADDADDLPIPGPLAKHGPSSIGNQYVIGGDSDDDAMSDELSWAAGHDDYGASPSDDMFDMEL